MAVVGKQRLQATYQLWDDADQTWFPTATGDMGETLVVDLFAGQGFQVPVDLTWINKPTGLKGYGFVMGFPRSAEFNPQQNLERWYLSES